VEPNRCRTSNAPFYETGGRNESRNANQHGAIAFFNGAIIISPDHLSGDAGNLSSLVAIVVGQPTVEAACRAVALFA
jgi:hypothetical protein